MINFSGMLRKHEQIFSHSFQGMSYTAFLVGYPNVVKSKKGGRGEELGVGVDVGVKNS